MRQRFAGDGGRRGGGKLHLDAIALPQRSVCFKSGIRLGCTSSQGHQAVDDELLDLGAGVRFQHRDEKAVEPLAFVFGPRHELEGCHPAVWSEVKCT